MSFEIVEIVGIKSPRGQRRAGVVLTIEDNNLFNSVKCIKIMELGIGTLSYQLSDRLYRL